MFLEQQVRKQYVIKAIQHPTDMTSDSFQYFMYSNDDSRTYISEMTRRIYLNESEIFTYSQYMKEIDFSKENQVKTQLSYYDTKIELTDTFTGREHQPATVQILVNNKNFAEPVSLIIRPTHLDNNRYHGYLGLVTLKNKKIDNEQLVIVQRLFNQTMNEEDFKWKTIAINKDGTIETAVFDRGMLHNPAYRANIIGQATASPFALGYHSNILKGYPTILFPLLYPISTIGMGIIFLIIGFISVIRSKRKRDAI